MKWCQETAHNIYYSWWYKTCAGNVKATRLGYFDMQASYSTCAHGMIAVEIHDAPRPVGSFVG
jgi:hypothetical protein